MSLLSPRSWLAVKERTRSTRTVSPLPPRRQPQRRPLPEADWWRTVKLSQQGWQEMENRQYTVINIEDFASRATRRS